MTELIKKITNNQMSQKPWHDFNNYEKYAIKLQATTRILALIYDFHTLSNIIQKCSQLSKTDKLE